MEDMNIKQTFLNLTSKTYPFGFEAELESLLPKGFYQDTNGNYFYKIGDSKTAFTSHLDTACKEQVNVKHVFEGDLIKTDGTSILGADDKAGVTILLYMIEKNVPGLYCFFIGEEVGHIHVFARVNVYATVTVSISCISHTTPITYPLVADVASIDCA